jgi:hypothetical protein
MERKRTEIKDELVQSDVLFSDFISSNGFAENKAELAFESNSRGFEISKKETRSIFVWHDS